MNNYLIIFGLSVCVLLCLIGVKYLENSAFDNTPEGAEMKGLKPSANVFNLKISLANKLECGAYFGIVLLIIISLIFSFNFGLN